MIIKRTVTLYHVTPTKNLTSILKYGLDPELGKPMELSRDEIKDYEKETGLKYSGMPYHYTHYPKTLYLSSKIDDLENFAAHQNRFKDSGGSMTLLEIRMPVEVLKNLQSENPKLLGARNWKEYKQLLDKYEPEVLTPKRLRGDSEKVIDEKVKKKWEQEKYRVCVRGRIEPGYIKVLKEIKI